MDEKLRELIEGAKAQGASNQDIKRIIDLYIADSKKKRVSESTSNQKPLVSNTRAQRQDTFLDTEKPVPAQDSDGLSGPPKMKEFTGFTKKDVQNMNAPQKPVAPIVTQQQINATSGLPTKQVISQYANIAKKKIVEDVRQEINRVDQDKIDQEIADEETKNQGFWNGLKQGASDALKSTWNAIADVNAQGLSLGNLEQAPEGLRFDTSKISQPFEKQLKSTDPKLPYEQRLAKAKEIFAKERAKNQIELNAESILSSKDPYVKEALKIDAINSLKANPKDKAISVQIQLINQDLEDIKNNPTPENLQKIPYLSAQHQSLTNEYNKNKYNLSAEDQVKLFSLNYGAYDKFTGDLTSGLGRMFGGAFNLAGDLTNEGVQVMRDAGILPKGFSQKNLDIIKENNPYSKIGENFTKGADAETAKYRQVSLSDIANSPEPVSEFGRWAGQTINGLVSFALPFAFGEGEAQLGAKLYIAASGAGNKSYEVNQINKEFQVAAADAYAKGQGKFEFDGKQYDTKESKGKELYSDLQKFSVAAGYGLVDYYMAGGRLNSLKGGAKAMENALGENVAKEQFENGLKASLAEAKGIVGGVAKKANKGGSLFVKVEAAKMFLDEKILDKKIEDPMDKLAEAYLNGAAMDLLVQGSPMLFGYVVGKVAPSQNVVEIKNNTNKILDYEKALESANEQDRAIIDSSIKELNDKNYNLVMKAYGETKDMTPKQIETLLEIEKQKINLKKDADYIRSEESELDPSDKKEILKGLKNKFSELENQKIDVFNSEFAALNVLEPKEQERLKNQAAKELGEGAKDDLVSRRAIEIHRVEIAQKAKEAAIVEEPTIESDEKQLITDQKAEAGIEEKSVPLHETLQSIEGLGKREKLREIDKNIDRIIKELGLETQNC
jgi:hypothetical protein